MEESVKDNLHDAIDELKPCPFCGEEPYVNRYSGGRCDIECRNMACPVAPETNEFSTFKEAAAAWNRRTVQHCRYEHTDHCTEKCSVCGREVETFHPGYRHCPRCGSYIEPEEWMRGFRSEEDMKEAGL